MRQEIDVIIYHMQFLVEGIPLSAGPAAECGLRARMFTKIMGELIRKQLLAVRILVCDVEAYNGEDRIVGWKCSEGDREIDIPHP